MTLKKISAISLVASTLLASTLSAGTLTSLSGSKLTVAEELFQVSNEMNISVVGKASSPLVFTTSFSDPSTVSDPSFEFTFTDAVDMNSTAKAYVVDENNVTVAYAGVIDGQLLKFTSDSNTSIDSGKTYTLFTTDDVVSLGESITAANTGEGLKSYLTKTALLASGVTLNLWSMSGTPKLTDTATTTLFSVAPEYSVSCSGKLDNLINVEDASNTFIVTSHGRNATSSSQDANRTDTFIFNVARADLDYSVGDNNGAVLAVTVDGNASVEDSNGTFSDATTGTGAGTWAQTVSNGVSLDFNLTSSAALTAGTDLSYTILYTTTGAHALEATTFTGSYYIDLVDYNTTVTPAGSNSLNGSLGEWTNFAYIAQIPAVSYAPGITTAKFYITNRSCASVTPTFKLIRDGEISYADMTAIATDSQGKYTVDQIVTAALADTRNAANDLTTGGPFAVELTLPGNAEDFYVAAQMQNDAKSKDLPVYNTSTRSY